MNAVARLTGLVVLGLAAVGLVHVVTDPPNFDLEPPSLSLPAIDDQLRVGVDPGMRMTFDKPMSWDIPSTSTVGVWWCGGEYAVIDGPTRVDNVCALAVYDE